MSASPQPSTVLVTGGSGFIAGWIVVALLNAGHDVRTTVRKLAREADLRATIGRHAPMDRLSFHEADLLNDAGWDAAAQQAGSIIHVASPMPVREYKTQDLVKPAREGVRRVLQAAQRAGIRHVVMTSSTVAAGSKSGDGVSDESVWTDTTDPRLGPYARSKTLAERDAWQLAQASNGALTLTTILPGMVQGPVLGRPISGSLELPLRMLTGKLPLLPRISFAGVEVTDLAELHIRALSDPAAQGQRIIAAERALWLREMATLLKARFGERAAKVSTREAPDWLIRTIGLVNADARFAAPELGKQRSYSSKRAQALLGRSLQSTEDAFVAAAQSLITEGLV